MYCDEHLWIGETEWKPNELLSKANNNALGSHLWCLYTCVGTDNPPLFIKSSKRREQWDRKLLVSSQLSNFIFKRNHTSSLNQRGFRFPWCQDNPNNKPQTRDLSSSKANSLSAGSYGFLTSFLGSSFLTSFLGSSFFVTLLILLLVPSYFFWRASCLLFRPGII